MRANLILIAKLCLVASALFIFMAPFAMTESYSFLTHSISESAGQGVHNAWFARAGFLLFGLGTLLLAREKYFHQKIACYSLSLFGVLMCATAAFSHKSWESNIPFDPVENWLHSATAMIMGFAISLFVVMQVFRWWGKNSLQTFFSFLIVIITTFIPLLSLALPEFAGLLQRMMFLSVYVWLLTQ